MISRFGYILLSFIRGNPETVHVSVYKPVFKLTRKDLLKTTGPQAYIMSADE